MATFSWRLTTLIEFVAAHHNLTLLQAVSKINGNPRLLALEKYFGPVERKFTSFYIPKDRQGHGEAGRQHVAQFFSSYGLERRHVDSLLQHGQMHVEKSGLIRLFGKDDEFGALEFVPEKDGKWQKRTVGSIRSPFFSKSTGQRLGLIYADPFVFMKHHGPNALSPAKHDHDILCLLEPNPKLFVQFIAAGRNLEKITFVTNSREKMTAVELDIFNNLKSHCRRHGIELSHGAELDIGRSRGIGFSR